MLSAVARWEIIDGPNKANAPVDGDLWFCTIGNVNDPAQRKIIEAVISRTVLSSDRAGLMDEIREAVDSSARTAIERFLDDPVPPDRIIVSSTGIRASDE